MSKPTALVVLIGALVFLAGITLQVNAFSLAGGKTNNGGPFERAMAIADVDTPKYESYREVSWFVMALGAGLVCVGASKIVR